MTSAVRRTIAWAALCSILLLVPCFWQPKIQAGDLSSHVYNAWLVQLIERGQAPGLTLAKQSNNILFDLMLTGLTSAFGPNAAQRVAVSIAVLVFFWGTFAFVWSWSRARPRRAPWQLAPCLAMLTYGWVFHMGFFNFYLSLGFCFGAMALLRHKKPWTAALAVLLFAIAYVAHALPVAWSAGVLVYTWAAQAIAPRYRFRLMLAALAATAVAGYLLGAFLPTRRGPDQAITLTGVDQIWLYGKPYTALAVALLGVWILCMARAVNQRGMARIALDVRFQLCTLTAAALVLLPGGVLLPGYRSALDYVSERMSLAVAILFCAMLASVRLPKPLVAAMAAICVAFFAFSYRDERALNQVEAQMEQAVAKLPPGQRVVSTLEARESRIRSMLHMVDRVCAGKCYSYANYEPCTAQFRVRADHQNPIVAWTYADSWQMQSGGYVVKPRDLPLYKVDLCDSGNAGICVSPLEAGDTLRNTGLPVAMARYEEKQP